MKNTVFTVIAVLLLLATVQFAVGRFTTNEQAAAVTIYNDYEETPIAVVQAELRDDGFDVEWDGDKYVSRKNRDEFWDVRGWWWIYPGESAHFDRGLDRGPMYFHIVAIDQGGQELGQTDSGFPIIKQHARFWEVIPETGRAFYQRDGHQSAVWPDSASFYTVWKDRDYWYWGEYPARSHHHIDTHLPYHFYMRYAGDSFQELEVDDRGFSLYQFSDFKYFLLIDRDKWKSEGILRRDPRQRPEHGEFDPANWPNSLLDELRVERGTFWRYPAGNGDGTAFPIRVGGSPPVTIDGLSLVDGVFNSDGRGKPIPDVGGNAFIIFEQYGNTCGPTSLEMVLHYYRKRVPMHEIWWAGDIDTVEYGTWPGEMKLALNELGVPAHLYDEDTDGYRNDPFERLRRYVDGNRPPCILIRYEDKNDEARYHWVVVVGYHYDSDAGIDDYLIADPNGKFRWESRWRLDKVWSFQGYDDDGYWQGGFDPDSKAYWSHVAVDLASDPYTAIVPQSGSTSHYRGYWTEMRFEKIEGDKKFWGGMRDWDWTTSPQFDYPFDFYTVSEIDVSHWGARAWVKGSSKSGDRGVKVWGRIEDGKWKRGELDIMVRAFRRERVPSDEPEEDRSVIIAEVIGAPSRVVSTRLLPNYPNPFNPETWIPYQLSEPAEVTVSVYAVDGTLVRTLELGQMPSGVYRSRSRAAYWDGRNARGEPVASGVYFYTLRAGDFSATRKLVIRK